MANAQSGIAFLAIGKESLGKHIHFGEVGRFYNIILCTQCQAIVPELLRTRRTPDNFGDSLVPVVLSQVTKEVKAVQFRYVVIQNNQLRQVCSVGIFQFLNKFSAIHKANHHYRRVDGTHRIFQQFLVVNIIFNKKDARFCFDSSRVLKWPKKNERC